MPERELIELLSSDHLLSDDRTLVLVEHGLGDADAAEIVANLAQKELVALDLRGNSIGDAGAKSFAAALCTDTCTLQSLSLWGNRIGVEGAMALSAALEQNRSLTALDLGKQDEASADHGDRVAELFASAIRASTSLCSLDLRYCGITSLGATVLAAALPKNTSLRQLDLRYNAIGAEGATALAVGLSKNSTALRVWVKANKYDDKDAAALADFLESDPSLAPLAAGQERLWF